MKHRTLGIISCAILVAARVQAATPPSIDAAIPGGLDFLAAQQKPDGAIEDGGPRVASTALALIAFLSNGHTPDLGKHGAVTRAAVDFLLSQSPEDGDFGRADGSRMPGHAVTTLALIEAYGVESREEARAALRRILPKSIDVIRRAQDVPKSDPHQGGWGAEPASADSDLAVTALCVLALRAAAGAGFDVPPAAFDRAGQFALRCWRPEQRGFAARQGGDASAAMTATGISTLRLTAARATSEQNAAAAKYILDTPVTDATPFPCYATHQVAHAARQIGGPTADAIRKRTADLLLPRQAQDGGWPASKTPEEPGRIYATSMAILTLATPLLPAYNP